MKKACVVVLVVALLVPALGVPAEAAWRGGGQGRFHHGGFHRGFGWGGLAFGLGLGVLLTAPWWYSPAYAYPAYTPAYTYPAYAYPYGYPAYSYPAYSYPDYTSYPTPGYAPPAPQSAPPPPPPPSSSGETTPPAAGTPPATGWGQAYGAPPASSQNCQTVWVEGHYETRVMQNGQRVTAWVPTRAEQLCQ